MKKLTIVAAIVLLCLFLIPQGFAADNHTVLCDDAESQEDGINQTDYYFDVGADSDGNGTLENPYNNFTHERVRDNSNIHLAEGEYVLNKSRSFSNISFYGLNPQSTTLNGNGSTLSLSGIVNFKNITLTNFKIVNSGTLNATNVYFTNLIPHVTEGNSYGGAIYAASNKNIFLDNCMLFNNQAEYGGAIYVRGGNLTILNSLFFNNIAYNYGGAIAGESRVRIFISNTRFLNDSSTNDAGGAIYLIASSLNASNLNISNCTSTFGAAITALNSDLYLANLTLKDNAAKYEGGAIYQIYGSVKIESSRFINNSARNGGALFMDDVKACNISDNEFIENDASVFAGAVYMLLTDCNITENDFADNSAYMFDDVYNASSITLTIGDGNYTMYVINQTFNSTLPSFYDLRQDGYVTSVKDQARGGNCWAFAALASLESCILKASGEVLDLSEENMKNLLAFYSDYGFRNRQPNDGGMDEMAVGYLVSWLGPVNESDDKYDDYSHISPVLKSLMHVQNVLYLKRDTFTDNDAIKYALLNYGGVATSMYFDTAREDNGKFYHYYRGDSAANHAVTIVGWDDNFKIPNAPGDGAWIAKNSWGEDWPDKYDTGGYFYVSYYDTAFARPGTYSSYTFILNDTQHFDKNYQYDVSARTDYFFYPVNTVSYENAFYATDDEFLAAVSTYFYKETEWQINVYVNSRLQIHQSGFSNPGYFTINLDYPIPLMKGDLFEIMFIIKVEGDAGVPISEYVSLNKLTYSPNISFIYLEGKWLDLFDLGWYGYPGHSYNSQVACIKGFTQLITLNASIRDLNVTYDSLDLFNITARLVDENDNPVRNGNVTFNVNGAIHTVSVYNGIASIQLPLVLGINNISALFNSPNYCPDEANTTFEVLPIALDMNITVIQDFYNAYINFTCSQAVNETLLISINNRNMSVQLINGTYQLNLTVLDYGEYVIEAKLDSDYYTSQNSTSFFVDVKKTYVQVDNLTTVYDSGEFLTIKLVDEFGEALSYYSVEYILNDVSCSNMTDGEGRIFVPVVLDIGNYTLNVVFRGDSLHVNSTGSSRITVNPSNTTVAIVDIAYDSFDVFNITVNVLDQFNREISNGTVTLTVNGEDYEFNVTEGIVKVQKPLVVGKNNISAVFRGHNYLSSNQTISFDVLPVVLDLNITVVQDFNNAHVSFISSQAVNETLLISLNNQNRSVELVSGKYELDLAALDYGEHVIEARLGSDFYTSANSTSFFVNVKRTSVEVSDLTTTYNSGEFLKIRLLDQFQQPVIGREVRFSIDGKVYITDENGTSLIPIILMDAVYHGIITFDGDDLYVKSENASTITVKSTIRLPETKDYALNSDYEVYLLAKDGSALKNTLVTFAFNGRNYSVLSDESGKATFTIPVVSGNYEISISNPLSGERLSKKLSVLKRITENKDISVYYGHAPTYKIRVCNDDGRFAGDLEVTITVNKKVYKLRSDRNGYVSLKINLNAGNYVVTSEYKGFKVSNKITVKPTLITKNIKVKKGKTVKFTAKLLNKYGNAIKGKKITFKVKGKTYKAKTNKKGIATIKIKNLKVGNYKVVSKYGKLKSTSKIIIKK